MAGQSGLIRASAQIITPAAKLWLATSQQARILHLFDHACNLVNEHGDVLALVSSDSAVGPFHIGLTAPFIPFLDGDLSPFIGIEMPVTNIDIELRQAVEWNPRMDWAGLQAHTAVWQPYIPQIQTMVQNYRAEMGLDTAVWQPKLADGLQQLLAGIAERETAVIQTGTMQLAGLGPGLTPAGDDMLLGVIFGLWSTWPEEVVRPYVEVMVATAVPHTTTLSAAWLKAAGRGEAGMVWQELGERLSVNDARWEEAVAQILATGHSSGADALGGFTAVVSAKEGIKTLRYLDSTPG